MNQAIQLFSLLADGRFHSGEELGAALGMSRASVWQHLQNLRGMGVDLHAVPGRGYRLAESIELLDAALIRERLGPAAKALLRKMALLPSVASTNQWLQEKGNQGSPSGSVCFAEHQSAGRGRRGRNWVSPLGRNIYCSLLWDFALEMSGLGGLSLAIGVAVAQAIRNLGAEDVGLKWPNDLLLGGRKVGGILLEVSGELGGQTRAVIGIGLNFHMDKLAEIDQPWADLRSALPVGVGRNDVAAALVDVLLPAAARFQEQGFSAFAADWVGFDLVRGRQVVLHMPQRDVCGIALGVDHSGALLLEAEGKTERYYGGEISLRMALE